MKRLIPILSLMFSVAAQATDLASHSIVIPIAARTPGIAATQWKTDLVVARPSTDPDPAPVTIVFAHGTGTEQVATTSLRGRETLVVSDVVKTMFGHDIAIGMIRVAATRPAVEITARARIYNTGRAEGEYGQTVIGMPLAKLPRSAYLYGVSGVDGKRTNVGFANPGDEPASAILMIYDRNGSFQGSRSLDLPPQATRQLNDVFTAAAIGPLDGAMIHVRTTAPVYSYASIVRADTGDADFVIGTGTLFDAEEPLVEPKCENPAPLGLAPLPARGWIVGYADGTDAAQTTAALAAKYGFTPSSVYLFGFHAELSQAAIAALRCEPSVRFVEQNGRAPLP